MNEYQMTHLTRTAMAERRAEADRHRLARAHRARRTHSTSSSSSQGRAPILPLRLRSILGRA